MTDAPRVAAASRVSTLAARTHARFARQLEADGIDLDAGQRAAVRALGEPIAHGVYLWGSVGRGKSMLADRYIEAIPSTRTRRVHYYAFFRELNARLVASRAPLERVVRDLVGDVRAICFDEFHVHDVADAIFLTRTLEAILDLDILVIATSNYAPASLMPDPRFHDRFAPAIELITSRLHVVSIGDGPDHRAHHAGDAALPRMRSGFADGTWTIDPQAHADATPTTPTRDSVLTLSSVLALGSVTIPGAIIERATEQGGTERVALVSIADLCGRPLGPNEYLALTEAADRVAISGFPDPARLTRVPAARLRILIDVLAERDVALDVTADDHWDRLDLVRERPADLERTLSRLALLRVQGGGDRSVSAASAAGA